MTIICPAFSASNVCFFGSRPLDLCSRQFEAENICSKDLDPPASSMCSSDFVRKVGSRAQNWLQWPNDPRPATKMPPISYWAELPTRVFQLLPSNYCGDLFLQACPLPFAVSSVSQNISPWTDYIHHTVAHKTHFNMFTNFPPPFVQSFSRLQFCFPPKSVSFHICGNL